MRTRNLLIKPVSAVATSVLLLAGNMAPVMATGEESTTLCDTYEVVYNFGTCQKGNEIVLTPHCNYEQTGVDAGNTEVSKLELASNAPAWATIDSNGIITCKPGEEVISKTYLITAIVTYTDGTQEYTTTRVCVMDEVKEDTRYSFDDYVLGYNAITVEPESNDIENLICLDIFGGTATLPEGTTFELAETVPSWITIDAQGNLTVQPSLADANQTVEDVVYVTYADGSSDAVVFVVTVKEKEEEKTPETDPEPETAMSDQYEPSYPDSKFVKTENSTIDIVYATETPSEASYTLSDAPEWVTINETTGQLSITGSDSIEAGVYAGKVVVTYKDDSSEEVIFNLEMTEKDVIVIEHIKVSPETLNLAPSQTSKLTVEVTPDSIKDAKFTYSSLDNSVATVSDDGTVKAVKEGKTTIIVRSENGKTAACVVEVSSSVVKVQAIRLDKEYVSTEVGKTYKLKYVLSPDNATEDVKVTWSVDDSSILTVDQNGKFKTLKKGTATITVKTDTGLTASCKVKVLNKGDVDTGTNTNSAFYIGGAVIAGIALIALLVLGRKKK